MGGMRVGVYTCTPCIYMNTTPSQPRTVNMRYIYECKNAYQMYVNAPEREVFSPINDP